MMVQGETGSPLTVGIVFLAMVHHIANKQVSVFVLGELVRQKRKDTWYIWHTYIGHSIGIDNKIGWRSIWCEFEHSMLAYSNSICCQTSLGRHFFLGVGKG
jgi:hypothetical protein